MLRELTVDEVDAIGWDSTGRDGDPRFPYKLENVYAEFGGRQVFVVNCPTCDERRAHPERAVPYHFPSRRCESGMRTHCSCDTCF